MVNKGVLPRKRNCSDIKLQACSQLMLTEGGGGDNIAINIANNAHLTSFMLIPCCLSYEKCNIYQLTQILISF